MSGECAGRKGVRPPRPKTKGAVLCGSAPLNGCGFGGGAAKRRPRFLASLPWFRTTGLLACPRPPPSLPGGFPSSGPMGSSGLQWRVRAGFSPASRASCGESPSGFRPDIMTFRRSLSRKGASLLQRHPEEVQGRSGEDREPRGDGRLVGEEVHRMARCHRPSRSLHTETDEEPGYLLHDEGEVLSAH